MSATDVQLPLATGRSVSTTVVKLPLVTGSVITFFLFFPTPGEGARFGPHQREAFSTHVRGGLRAGRTPLWYDR